MSDSDQRKIFYCLGNRQGRNSYCPIQCDKGRFSRVTEDPLKFKPLIKEVYGNDYHWFLILSPLEDEDREFYLAAPLTHNSEDIKNGVLLRKKDFDKEEGIKYYQEKLPGSIVLFNKICKIPRINMLRRTKRKRREDGTHFTVDYDGLITETKYNKIVSKALEFLSCEV